MGSRDLSQRRGLNAVRQHLSPNCGARRDGLVPSLIVIHYTAMKTAAAALERLCDPAAEVSAHYLIAATGEITQLVPEDLRAWHAGVGEWRGLADINSRSIGIELAHRGTHPFAAPQMDALEELIDGIMARWNIPPEGVIGHSDMAPGRKADPGAKFDWARLERCGRAARASDFGLEEVSEASFRRAARAAGYTADVDIDTLLQATRLRRAPWRRGPLVAEDFRL